MELFLEVFKNMVSGSGELMDLSIRIEVCSIDSETSVCDCSIPVQYKVEGDDVPCPILNVGVRHKFPTSISRKTIVEDVLKTAEKMLISCLITWFHNKYIPFSSGEIGKDNLYLGPEE